LIHHDIIIPFEDFFCKQRIDEIYHLACPASPKHYQKDPIQTLKTNFIGTLNILELARKKKSKILFTSTSEIYGDPIQHPQSESYWGNVNPIGIRACYDEGKRVSETLFMEYHRLHHVDTRIVRIFNTYGPFLHKDDGRVISNFIVQALTGEDLTIYGAGLQTRSFCYVDDMVDGFFRVMQSDCHDPINLGNPNELTVLELAHLIIEITESSSRIVFQNLPENDPTRRNPDITNALQLCQWEPKINLRDGLSKTIDYFRNELSYKL
jgi:UDP-glucuronate decarboxylase